MYGDVAGIKEKRVWGKDIARLHDEISLPGYCLPKEFRQQAVRFSSMPHYLKSKENWNYDQAGSNAVYTVTNYSYDNDWHGQPTRIEYVISSNNNELTIRNFPLDYSSTGFVADMAQKNRIEEIIEEVTISNTEGQQAVTRGFINTFHPNGLMNQVYLLDNLTATSKVLLSNFRFSNLSFDGYIPYQQGIKSSFSLDTRYYSLKHQFVSYGLKGNPLTISINNNVPISYRWDTDAQYPIAECINALSNEFFYEDFEGNGSIQPNHATSRTGAGAFSGTVVLSNYFNSLLNDRSYQLSYYKHNGVIWEPFQANYNGQTISGVLDDIRIYPTDAQMTTHTYIPQVGMSTATDLNGITTYFEYDDFGRLKTIKDHNLHILKTYEYHFKKYFSNQ
jgi:YD repeat-containing protein